VSFARAVGGKGNVQRADVTTVIKKSILKNSPWITLSRLSGAANQQKEILS
jgi:hypothetical protein